LLCEVDGFEELHLLCQGQLDVNLDCQFVEVNFSGAGSMLPKLFKRIFFASLWKRGIVSLDTNNDFVNADWLESRTKEKLQKARVVPVACMLVVEARDNYDQKDFNAAFLPVILAWPNVTVFLFDEFDKRNGIVRRCHPLDHYLARRLVSFIDKRRTWCGLCRECKRHNSGVGAYKMDKEDCNLLLLIRHVVSGLMPVVITRWWVIKVLLDVAMLYDSIAQDFVKWLRIVCVPEMNGSNDSLLGFVCSIIVEMRSHGKLLTSGMPGLFLEEGNVDPHSKDQLV
jgi:hypothetical protein